MNQELCNLKLALEHFKLNLSNKKYGAANALLVTYKRMFENLPEDVSKTSIFIDEIVEDYAIVKDAYKEIIENHIPSSFESSDYRKLKEIQTISELLNNVSKILEYYNVKKTYEKKKYMSALKHTLGDFLLEKSIENGKPITITGDEFRGIGKTTALCKKAHELKCLIVVPCDNSAKYVQSIIDKYGFDCKAIREGRYLELSIVQFYAKNGILLDEGVSDEMIKELESTTYDILGGFTNTSVK